MAKRYLYIPLFIALFVIFNACSKSDNSTPNTMTATTGDSTFTAETVSAGPVNGNFVISGTASGYGISNNIMSLAINNYNYTTDTVYIDGSSVRAYYNSVPATGGKISITSATNHHAQGTFNFYSTATGMNITGGYFDVSW